MRFQKHQSKQSKHGQKQGKFGRKPKWDSAHPKGSHHPIEACCPPGHGAPPAHRPKKHTNVVPLSELAKRHAPWRPDWKFGLTDYVFPYDSALKVYYADTVKRANELINQHVFQKKVAAVGFDTEFYQGGKKGKKRATALIQICLPECCLLLHPYHFPTPLASGCALEKLLQSKNIVKVGKSPEIDCQFLLETYGLRYPTSLTAFILVSSPGPVSHHRFCGTSLVDVEQLYWPYYGRQGSLKTIAERILRIPPYFRRTGTWTMTIDRMFQDNITYAIADAWVGMELYFIYAEVFGRHHGKATEQREAQCGGKAAPLVCSGIENEHHKHAVERFREIVRSCGVKTLHDRNAKKRKIPEDSDEELALLDEVIQKETEAEKKWKEGGDDDDNDNPELESGNHKHKRKKFRR